MGKEGRIIAQGQFDVNQENTEGLVLALNSLDRFISGKCWRKPVYLVYLVCFVDLVDLVHPVNFVQPNKQDKPNKPNNGFLPPARGRLTAEALSRYKAPSVF
jgi:hypothetical protein